ncbi:MAG: hypothetical protein MI757_08700 [Pirellulales bacterium]|nr:hypothetical protein [Pirellulales bacterium]
MTSNTRIRVLTTVLAFAVCATAFLDTALAQDSVTATQTTTTKVVVDSPVAPPPPKQEVIAPEPTANHVWIPGYWNRTPTKWSWQPGRWEKPPFKNARYVAPYWKYNQSKYEWNPGHWATSPRGVVVAKPVSAPPTFYEPVPKPPTVVPNQVWIAGHWNWNGVSWVWVPGYYTVPPAPKVQWVAGHWRKNIFGWYRWTPGHWATLP